ncbi:MAG: ATP-dependent helicase HrpB [Pseudomonadota bacterium]
MFKCRVMFDSTLPITSLLEPIREVLTREDSLVIEAPPGAGKTTLVPLALLDANWLGDRRIVMLQPRRLATRNAAQRMAELLGEEPGHTVGFRMRLETRVSKATRIEVVTEGVLLRMLQQDPSLAGVGLLIFDEIHERSLESDLGLALVLHARESFGDDMRLKVIAMSATLDSTALGDLLGASVLRSEGRRYPVAMHYSGAAKPRERITDRVQPVIEKALARHPDSSVLVFLPGQGEISRVAESLIPPGDVDVHPLYGNLDLQAQRAAIAASASGRRKVVLATNIAETSLTIDGIDVVIDSGLARKPRFDPGTGMSRLETLRISRAASEQRAGRAGRLRPGACYRLWSETQQQQLAVQDEPEIQSADLASVALDLFAWGVRDPKELRWQTPPPEGAWRQAVDLLLGLGALESGVHGLQLSSHGASLAELPLHPRLAHLLLCGQKVGAERSACEIAAVLSERDPVGRESPDMRRRLDYLDGSIEAPAPLRGWRHRTQQLATQLRRRLSKSTPASIHRPSADSLPGYLIACAYSDRIARRRHSGGYQLANGRSAQFDAPDALQKSKWLAVAEVGGMAGRRGDSIRSAAPLEEDLFSNLLAPLISESTVIDWDAKSGRFVAERQRRCGALLIASERFTEIDHEQRVAGLVAMLRRDGLARLTWDEATTQFLARTQLMETLESPWPGFSDQVLSAELDIWLAPYLEAVKRLSDLSQIDVAGALRARLTWEQQQLLERWLPLRIEVPSGSSLRIDYTKRPPVLAVKLQEMFGCESTPVLAEGRVPVVVHLLSPAGRPLQVTQDLVNFWRTGYQDVRKEMKGRYPKHPWPEDPLDAQPTRRTKARLER